MYIKHILIIFFVFFVSENIKEKINNRLNGTYISHLIWSATKIHYIVNLLFVLVIFLKMLPYYTFEKKKLRKFI